MVDNAEQKQDAPAHLVMQHIRARAYRSYLSQLKSGGSSGVSGLLGSAEDLFADPLARLPAKRLDTAKLKPADGEIPRRGYLLAQLNLQHSRKFLTEHIEKGCHAHYGKVVEQSARRSVSMETLDSVCKELSCLMGFICAVEQDLLATELPTWQQELFGNYMFSLDKLISNPSTGSVLNMFSPMPLEKIFQKAPSRLGKLLGFGEIGDPAWSAMRNFLAGSSDERCELLRQSLELPFEQLQDANKAASSN